MATGLIADDHPLYRDAIRGALMANFEQLTLLEAAGLDKTVEISH
ncbi:MAG: DNA-binding NarL/FixJ family response regulator [Paraglaciecola sp.]|jgi:DNA-binding NarL/FixJ family response regulator